MTMPSITEYKISGYTQNGEAIIESTEVCQCPKCRKGILKFRGRVRRHIRKEITGEKIWFLIPFGKCDNKACRAMRRLLPDFMVPHKHYEEEAISDVLEDVITEDPRVDFPSAQTMQRWKDWIDSNTDRIEGVIRAAGYSILGFGEKLLFSTSSLFAKLRRNTDKWLKIIIRLIYNSGLCLLPL